MQVSTKETLEKLKKDLQAARERAREDRSLLERREKVAQELTFLRTGLEEKHLQKARLESYNPKAANALEKQITDDTSKLETLELELKKLDSHLEISEAIDVEALENQLLELIFIAQPHARAEYEQMLAELSKKRAIQKELQTIEALFRTFFHHLKSGAETREASRRRGFFDYIFGRNPTVALSQSINRAAQEAENLLSTVDTYKKEGLGNSNLRDLYNHFHKFLEGFIQDAQKPWNQALYNEKYDALFTRFNQLLDELKERESHYATRVSSLEEKRLSWINSH